MKLSIPLKAAERLRYIQESLPTFCPLFTWRGQSGPLCCRKFALKLHLAFLCNTGKHEHKVTLMNRISWSSHWLFTRFKCDENGMRSNFDRLLLACKHGQLTFCSKLEWGELLKLNLLTDSIDFKRVKEWKWSNKWVNWSEREVKIRSEWKGIEWLHSSSIRTH